MKNSRLSIRLPSQEINIVDMFIRSGEFSTRSEFIRFAIREFRENHMDGLIKKTEQMQKLSKIVSEYELSQEYLKK